MNERIRCPNPVCPRPDDVQKVSIVVSSGTIEGLEPGSYNVMSSLSKQLAAPPQPEYTDKWGWKLIAWVIALGYLSLASLTESLLATLSPLCRCAQRVSRMSGGACGVSAA